MMSEDVWSLGIYRTKCGKRPDDDTVDLAAEAAQHALADAGVTMADIGVLAAGNLMGGAGGIGARPRPAVTAPPGSPAKHPFPRLLTATLPRWTRSLSIPTMRHSRHASGQ